MADPLSALIPTDNRFIEAFRGYRLRRPQVGAYVLSAIAARNADPFRSGAPSREQTVVPVFSPGLLQQLASNAASETSRQLDALRETFANFVLIDPTDAQSMKGASGETRIA